MNSSNTVTLQGVAYDEAQITELCRDPGTDPGLLEEVAAWFAFGMEIPEAYVHLATNPSVPMSCLLQMTMTCPGLTTRNPAFLLNLAMTPRFLLTLPVRVQAAIAGSEHVDVSLVRALATDRSRPVIVRTAAARNAACPDDMLVGYTRHAWQVRNALGGRPRLPEDLVERLSWDKKWTVRATIGRRRGLDPAIVERLSQDRHAKVRATIARRSDLAVEVARALASREVATQVKVALIRNRRIPDEVVAPFQEDPMNEVYWALHFYRPDLQPGAAAVPSPEERV